jgi:hypothetical protein
MPGATGLYSLGMTRDEGDPCSERFTVAGASLNGHMMPKACDTTVYAHGDQYTIFLSAGSTLTVDLLDNTYSAWRIELYDSNDAFVGIGSTTAPYHEQLKFNVPRDGFYTIKIMCGDSEGSYSMDIR